MAGVVFSQRVLLALVEAAMAREQGHRHRFSGMPLAPWNTRRRRFFAATLNVIVKSAAVLNTAQRELPSASACIRPSWGVIWGAAWALNSARSPSECCRDALALWWGKRGGVEKPAPGLGKSSTALRLGPQGLSSAIKTSPAPAGIWLSGGGSGGIGMATMDGSRLPRLLPLRLCQPEESREPPRRRIQPVGSSTKQGCNQKISRPAFRSLKAQHRLGGAQGIHAALLGRQGFYGEAAWLLPR